jgi:trigger factor
LSATTIKERQLPPADDDFAQLASEFDTLAELQDDLRRQAEAGKSGGRAVQARDLLLEQLLEAVEIPVPAGVIETEVHRHLESEGRLEDETHRAEVTEESTTSLRRQILLDTLAEQLDVKVSQSELVEYLVAAAQQYGMDPNEFIGTLDKNGQIPATVGEVARGKSLAVALRRVQVLDPAGDVVDLAEFIGTDADDQPAPAADADETDADADEVEGDQAPAAAGPDAASDISSLLGR